MRLKDQLLTVVSAYAEAIGRSEARVSTIVFGAGNAISRLRAGADMGSERIHDGLQWFSDHWPKGSAWPAEVPRPEPTIPAVEAAAIEVYRRRDRIGLKIERDDEPNPMRVELSEDAALVLGTTLLKAMPGSAGQGRS